MSVLRLSVLKEPAVDAGKEPCIMKGRCFMNNIESKWHSTFEMKIRKEVLK
jgi:hypothetical protein